MDPRNRFSNKVENYIRYRPDYPAEFFKYLIEVAKLPPNASIADIGSGTGISSKPLLELGYTVYAVEPNEAMRLAAEKLLSSFPQFISMDASAEASSLESDSVELVLAGQAFHWFQAAEFRVECQRILKPGGLVVLVWNERLTDTPFLVAYEALLQEYATDYKEVDHRNITDERMAAFFSPQPFRRADFPNVQVFDYAGIEGRMLSSSYLIGKEDSRYPQMLADLRKLFDRYQMNGSVDVNYQTQMYFGQVN